MEESWVVLVMLSSLCCVGYGHEDIGAQVELLKKALDQQRTDLQLFQSSMNTKMEVLRTDVLEKIVPSSINAQLEASLEKRSVDCIDHVASKIRHLERGYQQMRRQVNILSRNLRAGEMPQGPQTPGMEHQYQHLSQKMNHLQRDVNDTRRHVTAIDKDVASLKNKVSMMNETCQTVVVQKTELDEAVRGIQISVNETRRHVQSLETQHNSLRDNLNRMDVNHAMESMRDSVSNVTNQRHSRTTKPPFTSSLKPPSRLYGERTRVLVVRFWYKQRRKPHQIDMRSNGMKTYRHLRTSYVGAITYDAGSRRLIFSRNRPAGVYSCRLDVSGVTALRVGIRSWGITVDVARQLIFLTTFKYTGGGTVARMSAKGDNYSDIVDFSTAKMRAYSPVGITIDSRKRLVYFCTSKGGLWSADYDGKNLHRLRTGGMLRSVTMDTMNNNLYFSDRRKVMMLSLTRNVTTEVTKLGQDILKLVYYNNSVYISSFKGSIDVLHLSNNEHCNLKMMDYMKNTICLIP